MEWRRGIRIDQINEKVYFTVFWCNGFPTVRISGIVTIEHVLSHPRNVHNVLVTYVWSDIVLDPLLENNPDLVQLIETSKNDVRTLFSIITPIEKV